MKVALKVTLILTLMVLDLDRLQEGLAQGVSCCNSAEVSVKSTHAFAASSGVIWPFNGAISGNVYRSVLHASSLPLITW